MQEIKIDKELKCCPLCGAEVHGYKIEAHSHPLLELTGMLMPDAPDSFYIECEKCGLALSADSEEKVVSTWNTRIKPSESHRVLIPTLGKDYTPVYCSTFEEAIELALKVGGIYVK